MRKAFIDWNYHQFKSIKRDLLIFEEFIFDQRSFELYLEILNLAERGSGDERFKLLADQMTTTSEYLLSKNIFKKLNLSKSTIFSMINSDTILKKDYENQIDFLSTCADTLERYVKKVMNGKKLNERESENLFNLSLKTVNHNSRIGSLFYSKNNLDKDIHNLVTTTSFPTGQRKHEVLEIILKNVPVPSDLIPLDEVIDFRNSSRNRLRYLRFKRWVDKLVVSSFNLNEIQDEIDYFTLEFENRMKLEKQKYKLTSISVLFSLPLEIIEQLIKLQWSKIPKTVLDLKSKHIDLLISETKAPGNEIAYLTAISEKFK